MRQRSRRRNRRVSSDRPALTAEAHHRSIVVWDAPTAVVCGDVFSIKLGVKCSSGCPPDGWLVQVRDHDGGILATTSLGDEPWIGTDALYYAELELRAPDEEALYRWQVLSPACGREDTDRCRHDQAGAELAIRAVAHPECRLTVVAIDRKSQTPVEGATVVVHPYRARTDERGVAELSVPRGAYRVFVSGRNYIPFRNDGELTKDETIRAELDPDLGLSDAELWA